GEALRIALGAGDRARTITFRLLVQARRHTLGLRNDVIGIGHAFVDQALAILCRLVRVGKGFLHLLWRLYLLDRDVDDARSEAVAIEDRLDQREGVARDEVFLFIEDAVGAGAANHLAHGGLS